MKRLHINVDDGDTCVWVDKELLGHHFCVGVGPDEATALREARDNLRELQKEIDARLDEVDPLGEFAPEPLGAYHGYRNRRVDQLTWDKVTAITHVNIEPEES